MTRSTWLPGGALAAAGMQPGRGPAARRWRAGRRTVRHGPGRPAAPAYPTTPAAGNCGAWPAAAGQPAGRDGRRRASHRLSRDGPPGRRRAGQHALRWPAWPADRARARVAPHG